MLQSPNLISYTRPQLNFSTGKEIAPGVVVNPIDFSFNQIKPPFNSTIFHLLPGCQTPLDSHQEEEIWIVLEGSGILIHEGLLFTLKPQDAFFFTSFETHQAMNNTENLLFICSIYW